MKKNISYLIIILFAICFSSDKSSVAKNPIPLNTGARYTTSTDGVLRMYVIVWGHGNNPG